MRFILSLLVPLILWASSLDTHAKSFNYKKAWENVEDAELASTPKTAKKLVLKIANQARKDSNDVQLLRCLSKKAAIDNDCLPYIDSLKQFTESTNDLVVKSLAYYILGDWIQTSCNSRYGSSNHNINGAYPKDIREWTYEMAMDSAYKLKMKALEPVSVLKSVPFKNYSFSTSDFSGMALRGANNPATICGSVYDVLVYTVFYDLNTDRVSFVKNIIDHHRNDVSRELLIFLECERIKDRIKNYTNNDSIAADYNRTLKKYANDEASNHIRAQFGKWIIEKYSVYKVSEDSLTSVVLKMIEDGQRLFPRYKYNDLKELAAEMNRQTVNFGFPKVFCKNEPLKVHVSFRNMHGPLSFTISDHNSSNNHHYHKAYTFLLNSAKTYVLQDTTFTLDSLTEYGEYEYTYTPTNNKRENKETFRVSDILPLICSSEQGHKPCRIYVLKRSNGQPIAGADVAITNSRDEYDNNVAIDKSSNKKSSDDEVVSIKHLTTNADGFVEFPVTGYNSTEIIIKNGNDQYSDDLDVYEDDDWDEKETGKSGKEATPTLRVFTDRAAYRPGQTVYYKALVYNTSEGTPTGVCARRKVKLKFVYHQFVVAEIEGTTNDYGTLSGSFVLPTNCPTGMYEVIPDFSYHSSYCYFRVEEYKMPTFNVSFSPVSQCHTFGDTMRVNGKATYLMGAPLANAKVAYTISRQPFCYFHHQMNYDPDDYAISDSLTTDSAGNFEVSFVPIDNDDYDDDYCSFRITATVTSPSGESQRGQTLVSAGDQTVVVRADFKDATMPILLNDDIWENERDDDGINPPLLEMDKLNQRNIQVFNVNGVALTTNVKVEAYRQKQLVAEEVVKTDTMGNCNLHFDTHKWISGTYTFVFKVTDAKGLPATEEKDVILYRTTDSAPEKDADLILMPISADTLDWGDTIHVRIGSALKDRYVLCLMESTAGIVDQHILHIDSAYADVSLPFKKEYGKIVKINAYVVNDSKFVDYITHGYVFYYRHEAPKQLHLKLTTFRSKTLTGAKENWTLQLQEKDKDAEIVATMYNAALDKIYTGPAWCLYSRDKSYWLKNDLFYEAESESRNTSYGSYKENLKPFGNTYWNFYRFFYDEVLGFCTSAIVYGGDAGCTGSHRILEIVPGVQASDHIELPAPVGLPASNVRSNFNETAFFYPELHADKNGKVNLIFTMPEALTKWHFKAFVHTPDLLCGYTEQEIATQKQLMVMPTLPRFFRQGDLCQVATTIVNQSTKTQKGVATLLMTNPLTHKAIASVKVDFAADANDQTSVCFSFKAPTDLDMVNVKIIASTNDYSDGEEVLLPVLSNRVHVTQAMPMVVKGDSLHHFTFKALKDNTSSTLQNNLLKFEFCANPLWYVIQTLPDLQTPDYENCPSLLTAYSSAIIAEDLLESVPSMKQVVESWGKGNRTSDSLRSALIGNPEIKNILLEETPWLVDAKNESEQKQRLALMLNDNNLLIIENNLLSRLKALQHESTGGWCWFKGNDVNPYMSLSVLKALMRLGRICPSAASLSSRNFVTNTVNYVDIANIKRYYDAKEKYPDDYKQHLYLYSEVIDWLYASSFYSGKVKDAKDIRDFYLKLSAENWTNLSFSSQAKIAIAQFKAGNEKVADQIVTSLREHEVEDPNFGLTLKDNAGIATHVDVMEALHLIDPRKDELEKMCIWLLNQKRGNRWMNNEASINAIYALMLVGKTDWQHPDHLLEEVDLRAGNTLKVAKVGSETLKPNQTEAGTGYFAQTFKQINAGMSDVLLQKADSSFGWGSMYWQYTDLMQNITSASTDLQIDKTLTLEQKVSGKSVITPITNLSEVKVGDKLVVRLVIRCDRDLSYVCLKDQRSACLEPVSQVSAYGYSDGLSYYQVPRDASMLFFIEHLSKGTFVLEYPVYVSQAGTYQNGIATLQSLYDSAASAHSASSVLKVR